MLTIENHSTQMLGLRTNKYQTRQKILTIGKHCSLM